jgi:OPA family glycerol-3-phosphate transporter-like MFS transporter
MGRYNLTVAKNALGQVMTKEDFGVIFGAGTLVYGFSFIVNGPLTDRIGGKRAMLISVVGAAVMNLVMGMYCAGMTAAGGDTSDLRLTFSILYAANMYFQSFGAVAIVKVNASWFHVRERGGFSGIFGTMISSGIFFAFTVNGWILKLVSEGGTSTAQGARWVFYLPALLLGTMAFVELVLLRDRPSEAGHEDFDTGDASSGDTADVTTGQLLRRILTNPIILTVAFIEFCTGVLRQGVMHWYPIYAKEWLALPDAHFMRDGSWAAWYYIAGCFVAAAVLFYSARTATGSRRAWRAVSGGIVFLMPFLSAGWGGLLMVAGVIGGNVAGWVSDVFFQSRRAPAAGGLYAVLLIAACGMYFTLGDTTDRVAWVADNPKAEEAGLDQLRAGDRVLSIAGVDDIDRWSDVQRAIACVPARCHDGSRFDTVKCMCTNQPTKAYRGDEPDGGPIPARVKRGGRVVDLRLYDPGQRMRAGDTRTIKAGPVTTMAPIWLGVIVFLMSLGVIGAHGVLSGTATMDFGGRKGAATAVGVIDGFVYLGTAVQSFALGFLTPKSWTYWPLFMVPFALLGFLLTTRIWHAKPKGKGGH